MKIEDLDARTGEVPDDGYRHAQHATGRARQRPTAFFLTGDVVEIGATDDVFTNPQDKRTEDYITGRSG